MLHHMQVTDGRIETCTPWMDGTAKPEQGSHVESVSKPNNQSTHGHSADTVQHK